MKSIVELLVGLFILAFTMLVCFRVSNTMIIHTNARIIIEDMKCPVALDGNGGCIVTGDYTHDLEENVIIKMNDGSTLTVPNKAVGAVIYSSNDSAVRYRPFGKWFTGLVGISIIALGAAIAFGFPLAYRRRDRSLMSSK